MIGLGEAYISAYALACGLSERYSGLISTIPLGAASIIQLASPQLLRVFQSRRRFVIFCAGAQAVTLALLTGHAFFDRGSPTLLILLLTLYWFFGLSAGPCWNAWIVAIIPKEMRTKFFSQRGPFHEISVLLGLVVGGLALQNFHDRVLTFAFLFTFAASFRLVSTFSLYKLPDEPLEGPVYVATPIDLKAFARWLGKPSVLWMLVLIGLLNFGVSIGSPYFTPFMLKQMHLDYVTYMMLIATPFISRALAYKYFERLVRRVGVKAILLPSMLYISITPSLWAFFPTVGMIALFQLLSGIAWTGFEYGILIKQLADFSQAERSRVLTWTNLIVGIFNIIGVSIGSQMLGKNPTALDYNHLFELSSLMRFIPILVVFAIDWKVSARYIKKFYFRFLGARVNRGGVTRPILYVDENGEK